MDPTVTAAMITGFVGLIVGFLPKYLEQSKINKNRLVVDDKYKGMWKGSSIRVKEDDSIKYDIEFEFAPKGKELHGTCRIGSGNDWDILEVVGYSRYDRFLVANYQNTDDLKLQYGSFVANLSNDGTLEGEYIGFGPQEKTMIQGNFQVNKI